MFVKENPDRKKSKVKGIKLYEMMVKKFDFVIRNLGVEVKLELACFLEASPF